MPQLLDPVTITRGRVVGRVTSCSLDTEGYLLGQAFVRRVSRRWARSLSVLVTPHRAPKPQAELKIGDRVNLPVEIEIISRFPK
jgi:glycine hydroxymethyltransferase